MAIVGAGKHHPWNCGYGSGLSRTASWGCSLAADDRRGVPGFAAVRHAKGGETSALFGVQNVTARIEGVGRTSPAGRSSGRIDLPAVARHAPQHSNAAGHIGAGSRDTHLPNNL